MIEEIKHYFLKCDNCGTSVKFTTPLEDCGFVTIIEGFRYIDSAGFLMAGKVRDNILPDTTTLCAICIANKF